MDTRDGRDITEARIEAEGMRRTEAGTILVGIKEEGGDKRETEFYRKGE